MANTVTSGSFLLLDGSCTDTQRDTKTTKWSSMRRGATAMVLFMVLASVACGAAFWSPFVPGESRVEADATDTIEGFLAFPNPYNYSWAKGLTSCLGADADKKVSVSSCSPWNRFTYSVVAKNFKVQMGMSSPWCLDVVDDVFRMAACRDNKRSQQFDFNCHTGERFCNGTIRSVKFGGCAELKKNKHASNSFEAQEFVPMLRACDGSSKLQVFTMRDLVDTPHNAHVVAVAEGVKGSTNPAVLEYSMLSEPDGEYVATESKARLMLGPDGSARLVEAVDIEDTWERTHAYSVYISVGTASVEAGVITAHWDGRFRCASRACKPAAGMGNVQTFNLWQVFSTWNVVADSKSASSEYLLGLKLSKGFSGCFPPGGIPERDPQLERWKVNVQIMQSSRMYSFMMSPSDTIATLKERVAEMEERISTLANTANIRMKFKMQTMPDTSTLSDCGKPFMGTMWFVAEDKLA